MKRYLIYTYGCQMNVHESEKLAGILEDFGYTATLNKFDADVVVFNTCAIRESAEQKILGNIGDLKNLKKQKPNMIIAVCGCMSQQNGYADMLKAKFPFIDIIFGTHNISKFGDFLEQKMSGKKRVIEVCETENILNRDTMKKIRTSGVNAWINIMYGCNNFCTYCIVPYVRGREVSRPKEDILNEIKEVLKQGFKQITLLGQNVNSYGNDNPEKFGNFAELLQDIDNIEGEFWVKFMTSHPKDLSKEVIDVIAKSNKICHYLHLPVQSGSNRILKLMNRNYTVQKYLDLINYAKEKITDVEFSSDIIVGFPTETEEDFNMTLTIVKEVGFEQLFSFMYSKRKGTVAEKLEGQIPLAVKKERLAKLNALEKEIASNISNKFVGKTCKVLVEDVHPKNKNLLIGQTFNGKTISFEGDKRLIGSFVNIKVKSAKLTTISGVLVEEEV